MGRKKKEKIDETPKQLPKHRKFYINDELYFQLFYDPNIKDGDKIIKDFLESRLWKEYVDIFEVKKITKTSISKDLMEVYIYSRI